MRTDTELRLSAIEARNSRVELDKAWETSWTRRGSVAILTYVVVLGWLFTTGHSQPFIDAAVPPLGYLLSTLLLSSVRTIWQRPQS